MTLNGKSIVESIGTKPQGLNAKSSLRKALPQVLAVMVKNVLLLAYGTTVGYPTILIPGLSGQDKGERFRLNDEQISWVGSINMMCVPIGCFLSGVVTHPIGRKRAMQLANIPLLGCWLLFHFSSEVWQVYLALALTGLFGGLLEAPVLTYVAEITQPHLRGMLSATSSMAIIVGVLFQFLLGTFLKWRTLALVSCVFPFLSFCLLMFVPESPHWLVMKHRLQDARKSLAWLRGWTTVEEIEPEFQELYAMFNGGNHMKDLEKGGGVTNPGFEDGVNGAIKEEEKKPDIKDEENAEEQPKPKKNFFQKRMEGAKNFRKKNFLWPLSMVSFIYFLVHFSGATTLQTYAVSLFATLQAPIDKYYATVLLGVAEFIGCIICILLVKYTGKRVMAFISITGTGICATVTGTYAYAIDVEYFNIQNSTAATNQTTGSPEIEAYRWIPLIFLILLAFMSHCGLRVLPWILIGEIYSKETRATGCGISGAISYIFGFLANKTFLRMVALLTIPGIYWFYGSLSFVGLVVLYFAMPETEGKTLQEITDHFSGVSKLGNKVQRKRKSLEGKAGSGSEGKDNPGFVDKVPEVNRNDVESRL